MAACTFSGIALERVIAKSRVRTYVRFVCEGGHAQGLPLSRLTRRAASAPEEVDQKLIDALRLVVMYPMRCVGEALNVVEVGHIVMIYLGQLGAEEAIAL